MNDPHRLNRRTNIIIHVNEEAERFYSKSQELGSLAAESFQGQNSGNKKREHRAQMTGLENIAETTMKVSDVLDYIKKQTARQPGWSMVYDGRRLSGFLNHYQEYEGRRFGEILKNYIENDLDKIRERICSAIGIGNLSDDDQRDRQQVYLHLIRQLVRQLVVQYEYQVSELERSREVEKDRERR
ncbi:MAG: hypothetical protein M3Z08_14165 [Chloroflexota bacterium]|nr:hypothetical protein [Chloroflexota bacterium]